MHSIVHRISLLLLLFVLPVWLWGQGVGNVSIGNRLQNAARQQVNKKIREGKEAVEDEIREKKNEIKREVRAAKSGVKDGKYASVPRLGSGGDEEERANTMDVLIEDANTKASIEDRDNKRRFVNMFGAWWSLPSQSEFDHRKYLDSLRRAALAVDSSKYRVPKMVTQYQPVTIWGWHYAKEQSNNYKSYNYNVINTIAYASYDVNSYDGTPLNPDVLMPFRTGEFTKTVRQDTLKPMVIFLTISCHTPADVAEFLDRNTIAQQTLVDTVLMLLDSADANGVEIDFENIPLEHKDNFLKFVKKLTSALRKADPNYAVCVSVPSSDPQNVYDISQMRGFVDFFVIRAFDFYKKVKKDAYEEDGFEMGAAAPLNYNPSSPDYDLRTCIDHYINQIGKMNANRLILGLPYFGTMWEQQGGKTSYIDNLSYQQILFEYVSKGYGTVDTFKDKTVMRWQYIDSSMAPLPPVIRTIYFDDAYTLKAKYQEILGARLGGVALYQLGFDEGFDDLWALLANEFTTVDIPRDERLVKAEMASKKSRRFGTIALAVMLYLSIFMTLGFFMALLKTEVRQRLFTNGSFRLWFLGFFTFFLVVLGAYLGLFEGETAGLVLGILLGSFLSYLLLRRLAIQQAKQP